MVEVPPNARSYRNVTLHVSKGHAVGKTTLLKKIKDEGPKLISNLQRELAPYRKVFLCCHKWVEPQLKGYDTGFAQFDTSHWGAVDGENRWKDFDTAVIFGLPYRDRVWSANTFMALHGPQPTEWLNAEGNRPFQSYPDIRHALEVGQLVVNLVQAVNRTRNRKVIDAQGNCPPADIYILLPGDATGEEVLEGIEREMPGLKVVDWNYTAARRKPRRSNFEEALVSYAGVMQAGVRSASDIRRDLGIPHATWDRLVAKMKDQTSELSGRLLKQGVRYTVTGNGKRLRAHLAKTD